jgi:hypothetical protein
MWLLIIKVGGNIVNNGFKGLKDSIYLLSPLSLVMKKEQLSQETTPYISEKFGTLTE